MLVRPEGSLYGGALGAYGRAFKVGTGPAGEVVVDDSADDAPILLAVVVVALVLSGIRPYDRLTWLLETVWVMLGIALVLVTWRRFPLTTLLCCLLALHALVLIIGGLYTYARTPVGPWIQDLFGLSRNPYDRIGHFIQGFVPAILVREILVRRSPLRGNRWLGPLVVCACLAFSAFFEMIEWWWHHRRVRG
jgi:putative membrane protein